ncbi:type I restriction-modification system specificity subunit HsdS [Streptococcus pneumoniae]|uniref:restriction endonuclease subunit S n=2 Tax=Stutzerimonas stutzeri TaxID=316 RepID=UPI0005E010E3|nr:restriction endonuclease subunit S [Stutzerimonas stutzeri]MBA4690147.1 restriction endonuclease subunit S [Pseudomonas sp.]MCQ4227084.1 restriction endonuclease subunit S [Stutzerimonas stutzeri]CJL26897.1 type I restriction-modification system specificity subunit HsdS [Streptococcus pneumoniae]
MSHYKPYPTYKDSGVEWLGRVPEHWSVRKVKWEATARSGTDNKSETGSFPLYGANGVIGLTDTPSLNAACVLIGRVGSAGSVTFVSEKCGVSDNALLYFNNTYDAPRFDYYLLQSMNLEADVSKNAQPLITASDIRDRTICVPRDLLERRSIASSLDRETTRLDALIEKKTRFIELLREKRQALITHAVTKGLDPNVKMKDSGVEWLGEVPEHWDVKAIRWLSPVQRGASPRPIDDPKYFDDDGEYGWVRIEDVTASNGFLEETKQQLSTLGSSLSVKLNPGALFLSIAGSVGKPCITRIKACIHDGFVYFPLLAVDPMWLVRIFESRSPFVGLGKLGTQLNLNTETVGSIKVALPPAYEVTEILSALDRQLEHVGLLMSRTERSVDLLKERRSALITAAVTGQIDLREAV